MTRLRLHGWVDFSLQDVLSISWTNQRAEYAMIQNRKHSDLRELECSIFKERMNESIAWCMKLFTNQHVNHWAASYVDFIIAIAPRWLCRS